MMNDLEDIGWAPDPIMLSLPPVPVIDYDAKTRSFIHRDYASQEMRFTGPTGSGLFGEWSRDERTRFMRQARNVLRRYGFTRVPVWRKSLQDLL